MNIPIHAEYVLRNRRIAMRWEQHFGRPWAEIWAAVDFQFRADDDWSKAVYELVNTARPFNCGVCDKSLSWWELWYSPKALHDLNEIRELRCFYHRKATRTVDLSSNVQPLRSYIPRYHGSVEVAS